MGRNSAIVGTTMGEAPMEKQADTAALLAQAIAGSSDDSIAQVMRVYEHAMALAVVSEKVYRAAVRAGEPAPGLSASTNK